MTFFSCSCSDYLQIDQGIYGTVEFCGNDTEFSNGLFLRTGMWEMLFKSKLLTTYLSPRHPQFCCLQYDNQREDLGTFIIWCMPQLKSHKLVNEFLTTNNINERSSQWRCKQQAKVCLIPRFSLLRGGGEPGNKAKLMYYVATSMLYVCTFGRMSQPLVPFTAPTSWPSVFTFLSLWTFHVFFWILRFLSIYTEQFQDKICCKNSRQFVLSA